MVAFATFIQTGNITRFSGKRPSQCFFSTYASVAEMNKLSAPIKGNAGVFVLQMYGKDKLSDTFTLTAPGIALYWSREVALAAFISAMIFSAFLSLTICRSRLCL